MSDLPFDDLSAAYEAMIDWPKRLAHEEGFYRRLFERMGANRVLDVACGTGHHAAMFHSWGLAVEGADVSPAMIERCRRQFGESQTLRWAVRSFDQPHPEPGAFDVAICVGNSLALAGDAASARAVDNLAAAVRPGGAMLVQVLNLWRLPDGPVQWQKCVRASLPQGESLVIKGVHRVGHTGYVDVVVACLDRPEARMRTECVPFSGLEERKLEQMFRRAGASAVEVFGGYDRQPYDRGRSADLIVEGAVLPASSSA